MWEPRFSRPGEAALGGRPCHHVGDEGGYAPALESTDATLGHLMKAIEAAGYRPGEDVHLALDAAASEFYRDGAYRLAGEGRTLDASGMIAYYEDLVARYPIASIEDGLAEDDWAGWAALTQALGARVHLVGDDLFVTSAARLGRGIAEGAATPSWSRSTRWTLTETLETVSLALQSGFGAVMSHRSGETEDPPSPTSRSRPGVARSRPARRRVPTAPPSTTSSSASRRRWTTPPATPPLVLRAA